MAEDNGDVKDFKLLPPWGYLYVLLGIFHSFITKRPIPGSSAVLVGSEYCSHDLCFPFVFRLQLQRHLCCQARHAAIVFCSTAPVMKQVLHLMLHA